MGEETRLDVGALRSAFGDAQRRLAFDNIHETSASNDVGDVDRIEVVEKDDDFVTSYADVLSSVSDPNLLRRTQAAGAVPEIYEARQAAVDDTPKSDAVVDRRDEAIARGVSEMKVEGDEVLPLQLGEVAVKPDFEGGAVEDEIVADIANMKMSLFDRLRSVVHKAEKGVENKRKIFVAKIGRTVLTATIGLTSLVASAPIATSLDVGDYEASKKKSDASVSQEAGEGYGVEEDDADKEKGANLNAYPWDVAHFANPAKEWMTIEAAIAEYNVSHPEAKVTVEDVDEGRQLMMNGRALSVDEQRDVNRLIMQQGRSK